MAGELKFVNMDNAATARAIIYDLATALTRWNGTTMVDVSTIADGSWATGLITLTEDLTSTPTGNTIYTGDVPGTLAGSTLVPVQYIAAAVEGATPAANAEWLGFQVFWWNGAVAFSDADLALADIYVNEATTPWREERRKLGTSTVLAYKDMKQPGGSNLTSAAHRIGRLVSA